MTGEPSTMWRQLLWPLVGDPQRWKWLWLIVFSYGFFIDQPSWNQNSRFALTRAMVEDRSVQIDRFHVTTGDKSFREGHFYCDKAPGVSWMAVLPYSVFYTVRILGGRELPGIRVVPLDPLDEIAEREPLPEEREPGDRLVYNLAYRVALYLCCLFSVVPLAVLGLGAVYLLGFNVTGGSRDHALRMTLIYGFATPAFAYSTAMYGHQPCADLLVIAFALIHLVPSRKGQWLAPLLCGQSLAWAVLVEYPAAIPVLAICLYAFRRHGIGFFLKVAIAGLPWAVALGFYHDVAFGSVFSTGYDFVYLKEFAEGMRVRYGIGAPQFDTALNILFGSYRGLFYLSPVLLLAVWGWGVLLTTHRNTFGAGAIILCWFIITYYIALNSGYYMWDGGAALGPRHCLPMLPFLCLGFVVPLQRIPWASKILAVVSGSQMLLAASARPEAPQYGNPVWTHIVPRMFLGTEARGEWNTLGNIIGLHGGWALIPLIVLWALSISKPKT